MALLSLPRRNLKRLIAQRRASGADRYDEVWNGVYVMSPEADNTHQELATRLASSIDQALGNRDDVLIYQGCNLSDRPEDWSKNYRIPDVAVFLPGNPAEDRSTHWLGGPDFAVEIISSGDRSRKKFAFYAAVGVHELLLVSRRPWRLELYRREGAKWNVVGIAELDNGQALAGKMLGVTFQLVTGHRRPRIEVVRASDGQKWIA
jgi:Uma2 family endonuclease